MDNFSRQIIRLRQSRGLSQAALAKAAGIPQTTLSRWESGAAEPSLSGLRTLAAYLDVSADVLVGLASPPDQLRPGHWLIDVDAVEERRASRRNMPGQSWAAAIPERYRLLTSSEFAALLEELSAKKPAK